jgi:hypothetical protein
MYTNVVTAAFLLFQTDPLPVVLMHKLRKSHDAASQCLIQILPAASWARAVDPRLLPIVEPAVSSFCFAPINADALTQPRRAYNSIGCCLFILGLSSVCHFGL